MTLRSNPEGEKYLNLENSGHYKHIYTYNFRMYQFIVSELIFEMERYSGKTVPQCKYLFCKIRTHPNKQKNIKCWKFKV